jgi:hypothetical protein
MGRFVLAGEIALHHRAGEDEQVAKPLQFLRREQRGPGRLFDKSRTRHRPAPRQRRARRNLNHRRRGRSHAQSGGNHRRHAPNRRRGPAGFARRVGALARRVAALDWIAHKFETGAGGSGQ